MSLSVCFLYRLLRFSFLFASSLLSFGGGFCFSVISSRRSYTPPPRAPCEPEACVRPLRAVSLCVANVHHRFSFMFSSLFFLPFFDFDLDIVCFIVSFACGYYDTWYILCCLLGFGFWYNTVKYKEHVPQNSYLLRVAHNCCIKEHEEGKHTLITREKKIQ